ncbi:hypothetical protein [Nostoc sp. CALU 1950]|uniref:hypothetical protein n=1 Tax=Nostoc sp. CALU 1950 TaxID=3104321 RepID=UPI003EBD0EB5
MIQVTYTVPSGQCRLPNLSTVPVQVMLGRSETSWLIGAEILPVTLFFVSTWF